MQRRTFLLGAAALPMQAAPTPVIDTHIHLFDTTRKQGVPWPGKDSPLYQPALPARYKAIVQPLGVTGAIVIEASAWFDDNQWVLDTISGNPLFLGMVGNLEPGKPGFAQHLDRLHRNPLFLGIRYGNLWDRNLTTEIENPQFVADLKLLAQAGLSLDTANPNPALIQAVLQVTGKVPSLRVVMDHLPQMDPATAPVAELAKHPNVYVKLSGIVRRVEGRVPLDLPFYRDRLDTLFALFGEDRVLFGSDWPNSDRWAEYPQIIALARAYFAGKSATAQQKYFGANSRAAYRWRRAPGSTA